MDHIEAKLASGEYQLVDKTLSKTKSDIWEKFGVIIEHCRAEVLTLNMHWAMHSKLSLRWASVIRDGWAMNRRTSGSMTSTTPASRKRTSSPCEWLQPVCMFNDGCGSGCRAFMNGYGRVQLCLGHNVLTGRFWRWSSPGMGRRVLKKWTCAGLCGCKQPQIGTKAGWSCASGLTSNTAWETTNTDYEYKDMISRYNFLSSFAEESPAWPLEYSQLNCFIVKPQSCNNFLFRQQNSTS